MTERRVNVRLAAVGGNKLKADLVSIGKEGRQALRLIEESGAPASAGLNLAGQAAGDLMVRLEALASRAARAAANMNDMAATGGSVMSRVNQSTGVTGRMARDSEDIAAYGRALDDLRAKFNPLFAEQRRHAESIAEIDRAARVGAITLEEWVSATRREEAANAAAANSIRQRQAAFDNFVNTGLRDKINEIVGVTGTLARTSDDMAAFSAAMDDARAKFSPLYAEMRRHNDAMAEMDRLYKADILSKQEFISATNREVAAHAEATAAIRQRQAALDNMVNTGLRDRIDSVTGVSGDLARNAEDVAAYGRALDDARAKYNPLFATIRQYLAAKEEVKNAHRAGAISADEETAALSRLRQAHLKDIAILKGRAQGYQQMEKAGGLARFQMVQLGYQLNDIGVSLASGQNPFVVLVQQGAQIQQIYGNGNGGVTAMFRQMGQMIRAIPGWLKLIAIVGGTALGGLVHEINEVSSVTVTLGDTALAVWQVISEGIYDFIKPATDKIGEWFSAAWDVVIAGVKLVGNSLINGITIAVTVVGGEWKRMADIAVAAYEGIRDTWGLLPSAIGDFAYQAANSLISGVESMLNAVVERINSFIGMLNNALSALPEWAVGEGGIKIGELGEIKFGRIDNPYAGAGKAITDVAGRITAAATQTNEGLAKAGEIWNRDPMGGLFDSVRTRAEENARKRLEDEKKKKGGGGGKKAEKDETDELIKSLEQEMAVLRETDPIKKKMLEYSKQLATATDEQKQKVLDLVVALDKEKNGFAAIPRMLKEYAESAKRMGEDIGKVIVGAFDSAADALAEFVKTGKLSISDLATSIIADFARIAFKSYIMGPIASGLGNALSGSGVGWLKNIGASITAAVQHTGGSAGFGAARQVPAVAFANAPRLHSGTPLGLRSDEYAAILQRGERVLNRRQTQAYESGMGGSPTVVNINGVRDMASFRKSRTQIAADMSRFMGMSRRAM